MLTRHIAITSVRGLSVSSAVQTHEFGRAYIRSIDSRSTVGMNRAAICPPIPVVCPVEWPYRNKFSLKKRETFNAHNEHSGRSGPVQRVNYNF
jgi:hypothetical protein